jgi:hypothetical protein
VLLSGSGGDGRAARIEKGHLAPGVQVKCLTALEPTDHALSAGVYNTGDAADRYALPQSNLDGLGDGDARGVRVNLQGQPW